MKPEALENKIFVSRLAKLRDAPKRMKFDGLYFGHEFCEHLFPAPADVRRAIDYCETNKLTFHLVLPPCYENGLRKAKALLKILPRETEVVFNDFGLLAEIREAGMAPVAGRLLFPHSADPRAAGLPRPGDGELARHLCGNAAFSPGTAKLLQSYNVARVEFDNAVQGIGERLPAALQGSLYYPYVYTTTARKCLTRYAALGLDTIGVGPCPRVCEPILTVMKFKIFRRKIYLKGNTQFYSNPVPPDSQFLLGRRIDRLVYMPDFPF
jgi:hypothetical protein